MRRTDRRRPEAGALVSQARGFGRTAGWSHSRPPPFGRTAEGSHLRAPPFGRTAEWSHLRAPPFGRTARRHRQLRSAFAGAAAALYAFVIVTASGCGPDAVGVDDCRQIEQARCEAGADCGLVTDLDACKRFYRDHCLHGMTLESAPRKTSVDRCVDAIRSVGTCGKTNTATADCSPIASVTTLSAPCDAVDRPEDIPACSFLVEKEQPAADASGGDASGGASNDAATDSATD